MTPDLRQFLPAIPPEMQPAIAYIAAGLAAFGLVLWLVGARLSRSLITLVGVAVGTALGLQVPRWLGLAIGTWATAVGGALVLGVLGYILHRAIIKVGLGLIMGVGGAVGVWLLNPPTEWELPAYTIETDWMTYAQQAWQGLPAQIRSTMPMVYCGGLLVGFVIGTFLPRLAVAMVYSVIGLALMGGMGLYAAAQLRPQWLDYMPQGRPAQLLVLGGLALGGTLLQWWLLPRPASRRRLVNKANLAGNSADKQ